MRFDRAYYNRIGYGFEIDLGQQEILHSELIGLWKDREDIEDSAAYARQLREQAQRRRG